MGCLESLTEGNPRRSDKWHTMIVFATAEPFGHYHLHPYASVLDGEAIHLIPYPQPVQGEQVLRVTADLGILDIATLLVVTGGTLTPWTEVLSWEAHRRGIPVVFSETAYPSREPLGRTTPPFALITASSPYSQEIYAQHFNTPENQILILGHPLLDGITALPAARPNDPTLPHNILLLSSVGLADTHRAALQRTISILTNAGHRVTVRPHPREDHSLWTRYTVTRNQGTKGLLADLATTDTVVGIPGTAYLAAAAAHKPIITVLDPSHPYALTEPTLAYEHLSLCTDPESILETLSEVRPAPEGFYTELTGPVEGSVVRHVTLWKSLIR